MRIVLLALVSGVSFCQGPEVAKQLLQEVADSAAHAASWRIEGSVKYMGSRSEDTHTSSFAVYIRSPDQVRFEQTGQALPAIILCNSTDAWIYSPVILQFKKEPATGNHLCSPIVGPWKRLPVEIQSPKANGHCGPDPTIHSSAYTLVRGVSEPELTSAGRLKRTLCIDPARKLVLWEKWESRYGSQLYVYSRLDKDVEFDSKTFTFVPPDGSRLTDFDLPAPRPLGTPAMPRDPAISLPRLISKKTPDYPQAARDSRLEGTVTLYVVIGREGAPAEIFVYSGLRPDFDREAVKTVRQWRFSPAMRNGEAIALGVTIDVNFRMR